MFSKSRRACNFQVDSISIPEETPREDCLAARWHQRLCQCCAYKRTSRRMTSWRDLRDAGPHSAAHILFVYACASV